jgi:hypothetical protein
MPIGVFSNCLLSGSLALGTLLSLPGTRAGAAEPEPPRPLLQTKLTGGGSNVGEAKLCSVRAGVLGPAREAEKPRGKVLLAEDFTAVPEGDLPRGWPDRGRFAVEKEAGRLLNVHPVGGEGVQWCRLPPAQLAGNFFVECELRLGTGQQFQLLLEGGDAKVPVVVDRAGSVWLEKLAPRQKRSWNGDAVNRLRLEREGDRYVVRLKDVIMSSGVLEAKAAVFEKVGLGLTAGDSNIGVARISSVKAAVLEPAAER